MTKRQFIIFTIMLLPFFTYAQNGIEHSTSDETDAVIHLVESTYVAVLYNGNKDLNLLRKGFHEEFNMYVYYEGEFRKATLEEWIARIEANRKKTKKATTKKTTTWKLRQVDVAGQTAMVILEVYSAGKIKYTDYLTLYKIEDEWKVMTKLFSLY